MPFSSSYIGPLTTTFTPPARCFTDFNVESGSLFLGNPAQSDCYPSGFSAALSASGYYAPAVCPSGYYTACAAINSQSLFEGVCCPTSWTCSGQLSDHGICTNTAMTILDSSTIYAVGIRFQQQAPSPTAPVNGQNTAAPGASARADLPQTTGTTNGTAASAGLTLGAEIAIGVTIPVVLCILAVVCILLCRRHRKNNADWSLTDLLPFELDADDRTVPAQHEMPAASSLHELDPFPRAIVEMDSDSMIEAVARPALGEKGEVAQSKC